jgi:uncharacterized protein (TIGR03437 family)
VGVLPGPSEVDRVDPVNLVSATLPALGVWQNQLSADATLAPAPNGATILLADSNGNIMLYAATGDTFVASRRDFSVLQGAIAASSYGSYIVGDNVLNGSVVPAGVLDTSVGATAGFAFVNQGGFRLSGASASGPGAMENLPALPSAAVRPTLVVESPVTPGVGNVFTRAISPLAVGTNLIAQTTSGFTVVAWSYDAVVTLPTISSVVNAANGGQAVAPGGLISIMGQQMSLVTLATSQIPLPTALAQSCVKVNGTPVPLLLVSNQQINAQLPYNVTGNAALTIMTPGGESDSFYFTVSATAPTVFMSGTAGPLTGLAAVVRWNNGELVTPTNPIHANDWLEIYLTGMGATTPAVPAGQPGPSNPFAVAQALPSVTLGGHALTVSYAGMAPGEVGVYQIDALVPPGVPTGINVPLEISQGDVSTPISERVVN